MNKKIALNELKLIPELQEIRPTDGATVERYKQALRQGDRFPDLVVTQDNQLVSGYHRREAYAGVHGEDYTVECTVLHFDSLVEMLTFAIRENVRHGRPIDQQERSRAMIRMLKFGLSEQSLAELFRCSIRSVEQVSDITVVKRGAKDPVPLSPKPTTIAAAPEPPAPVTETDVKALATEITPTSGKRIAELVSELSGCLRKGWVDHKDPALMKALAQLEIQLRPVVRKWKKLKA
jgi:hypothetical protein